MAAYVIDYIIVIIVAMVLGFVLGVMEGLIFGGFARATGYLLGLVVGWLYWALQESSKAQATWGKRMLGLRVTDSSGERINFGRATGRWFGKLVSGLILCVGYMMAGWTQRKQALHDLMAGTFVVRNAGLDRFEETGAIADGVTPRSTGMPGWAIALIVVGACVFLIVPILAAIAIPAYQDYVIRSQVSEGVALAEGAKTSLAEYYSNLGGFPGSNASAGLASPASISGKYVSSIDVGQHPGVIEILYSDKTPQNANANLDGKVLALIAVPQGTTGNINWVCGGSLTTVPAKYRPTDCRDDDAADRVLSQLPTSAPATAQALAENSQAAAGGSNAAGANAAQSSADAGAAAAVLEPTPADFSKYASTMYAGLTVLPDFSGAQKKFADYRTRILDGFKSGTNFAGSYSVITFGCGTECMTGYIADLKTGNVYDLPWGGENNLMLQLAYAPNSNLIAARYVVVTDNPDQNYCEQDVVVWDGGGAHVLSKGRIPFADSDPMDGCQEFSQQLSGWLQSHAQSVAANNTAGKTQISDVQSGESGAAQAASPQVGRVNAESAAKSVPVESRLEQAGQQQEQQGQQEQEQQRSQQDQTQSSSNAVDQPDSDPGQPTQVPEQQAAQQASAQVASTAAGPTPDDEYFRRTNSECARGMFGKSCRHNVREQVCANVAPGTPGASVCKQ